jgi:hypothetical protein
MQRRDGDDDCLHAGLTGLYTEEMRHGASVPTLHAVVTPGGRSRSPRGYCIPRVSNLVTKTTFTAMLYR